jgi:Uncharacterised nucleotidyltransferase
VAEHALTDGGDALAACAAYGLPTSKWLPPGPLARDVFTSLVAEAEHHRVLGFLGEAVRGGALAVDPDQHVDLEEKLERWLAHALRVEALLLSTIEELERAGIDHRVFKGVALANTVYEDPSLRVFADIDVLVPSSDFAVAASLLAAALGTHRSVPELRPGFDARFGREAMLRSDAGLELDVHRTFVDGAYGLTVELDDLFVNPRTFALGGRDVATLPPVHQLLSSCYSAALGDWPARLASQRDVVQLLHVDAPSTDDVLALARRWRAEPVVACAIAQSWAALEPQFAPPLVEWARNYVPGAFDRILLASYRGPARGLTTQAAGVLVVPGAGLKLAYLRAITTPQRGYLQERGLTAGDRWRRGLARLWPRR